MNNHNLQYKSYTSNITASNIITTKHMHYNTEPHLFKIICSNFCHTNATESGETEERVSALQKALVFRKDSLIKLLFLITRVHRAILQGAFPAAQIIVEHVWNVMARAQKPDLVFQRNVRVHLNRRGSQFSRLLAVEECGSAGRPWIDRVLWHSARVVATLSNHLFPLHFPSHASPYAITFQTASTNRVINLDKSVEESCK